MTLTLNKLNNIEALYPMKIIKCFDVDKTTIKNKDDINQGIKDNIIAYIYTDITQTNTRHMILIFKDEMSLNNWLKCLNTNKVDYQMSGYVYRKKTFLNELFNEYGYKSSISL